MLSCLAVDQGLALGLVKWLRRCSYQSSTDLDRDVEEYGRDAEQERVGDEEVEDGHEIHNKLRF